MSTRLKIVCPTCGNTVETGLARCVFCDTALESSTAPVQKPKELHKRVNLEYGRPVVESALKRMHSELESARLRGVRVVTLIHGYGSSGKGGKIRIECRKSLEFQQQSGMIKTVIYGEAFNRRSGLGKSLVRQYPDLGLICRSDFNNPGITVVEF